MGIIGLGAAALLIVRYAIKNKKYTEAQNASSEARSVYEKAEARAESDYRSALSIAEKNNREADAEQKAWDKAWDDWFDNVLKTAYLATTNDIFGRFTRALSSSVKLTIKELFEDKKAELKDRQEKEYSEEHIEKLIREIREKKERQR